MLGEKFYIPTTVEERAIKLGDGTEEVLFFRHLENTAFELFAMQSASGDEDVASKASARLLVAGLCDSEGKPVITIEQAVRIKRPIMQRMVAALLDVNGYGKAAADKAGKG